MQSILNHLFKLFGKENVIKEGNKIIVGVDNQDRKYRDDISKMLAKSLKGTEKNRVVSVGVLKIHIKPKTSISKKKSPEENNKKVQYAYLKNFFTTHSTSAFLHVCDPLSNKSLPNKIKEKSDIFIVSALNSIIKKKIDKEQNDESGTTISIGGKKYTNVICCVPIIRGDEPKADICLVCISGKNLVPKGFFSYKLGTKPTDFGGYSGITIKAGKEIFEHPEVKSFVQSLFEQSRVGRMWKDKIKTELKYEPYRTIKSNELKKMCVFGPQAMSNTPGVNNCDALLQGTPKISGNTISFDHMQTKSSGNFDSGYVPVFGARKASDRGFNYGPIRLENLRIGIFQDGYRSKWKNRDKESEI